MVSLDAACTIKCSQYTASCFCRVSFLFPSYLKRTRDIKPESTTYSSTSEKDIAFSHFYRSLSSPSQETNRLHRTLLSQVLPRCHGWINCSATVDCFMMPVRRYQPMDAVVCFPSSWGSFGGPPIELPCPFCLQTSLKSAQCKQQA